MDNQYGNYAPQNQNPEGNYSYQQEQQPYQPQQGYPQGQQPGQYPQPGQPQNIPQAQPAYTPQPQFYPIQNAPPAPLPMDMGAAGKRKKGSGFALGLVAGILVVAIAGGILLAAGLLSFGKGGGQVEGGGYATGEDAVAAYIEGLAAGDLNEILAACAVESYTDGYDFVAQLERLQTYFPAMDPRMPVTSPLSRQLNITQRRNTLVTGIYYQAMTLCAYEEAFYELAPVLLSDDADLEDFLNLDTAEDFLAPLSTIELLRCIDPEDLSDMYSTEPNRENFSKLADIYGADELASVAAVVEMDGEEWLMCFDVGRYDGQWYVMSAGGNIGILLGLSAGLGGVAPAEYVI